MQGDPDFVFLSEVRARPIQSACRTRHCKLSTTSIGEALPVALLLAQFRVVKDVGGPVLHVSLAQSLAMLHTRKLVDYLQLRLFHLDGDL